MLYEKTLNKAIFCFNPEFCGPVQTPRQGWSCVFVSQPVLIVLEIIDERRTWRRMSACSRSVHVACSTARRWRWRADTDPLYLHVPFSSFIITVSALTPQDGGGPVITAATVPTHSYTDGERMKMVTIMKVVVGGWVGGWGWGVDVRANCCSAEVLLAPVHRPPPFKTQTPTDSFSSSW